MSLQKDVRLKTYRTNKVMCFSGSHLCLTALIGLCFLRGSAVEGSPRRQFGICGPAKCNAEREKFHYATNHIYVYEYKVNATTSIVNGPAEESGVHLSCDAAIKFLSPCEGVLTLSDVELWESNLLGQHQDAKFKVSSEKQSGIGRQGLEEFPLRFSYLDGKIEEICPNPMDAVAVVNIKKGLLSTLQNTMRRLDLSHKGEEDDVHGRCKTEYRWGNETSSSLTLERIKDINSCGDRFGISSSVKGVSYAFGTVHQSMPAVSSTSECIQTIDRNLISSATCEETHHLKSLSRGIAGAATRVHQKLNLIAVYVPSKTVNGTEVLEKKAEEEDSSPPPYPIKSVKMLGENVRTKLESFPSKITARETLTYTHKYGISSPENAGTTDALSKATQALTSFCASVKVEVGGNAGEGFANLIDAFRGLTSSQLESLYQRASGLCGGNKTPFDDALEATETAASMTVIRDRIKSADAPIETIKSWIASMTYISNPDLALMNEAVPILRNRTDFPEIILSYSTLARTYCRSEPKCMDHYPVSILVRLYEKYFNAVQCRPDPVKGADIILMYLKGLGNFGIITPQINQALLPCATNPGETEIRVAAIQAYRRAACGSFDVGFLKEIFTETSLDSEIRIQAFIALMKCPSYATIKFIHHALLLEQVNQVGSYVYSYIRNLQETALPSKAELQGLVSDETLIKKFADDIRKFSRNFEVSSFYDDYNLGAGVDADVIYSENSYIPRSASVNLTVDLFGESVNVLEAGVRLESFEHYIESIFGPKSTTALEKRDLQTKRKLRGVMQEFDAVRAYYKEPVLATSLRIFGNEIHYDRRTGAESQLEWLRGFDPLKTFGKLKNADTEWQKSTLLLDSSYIIPTGAGLPLNLSAQASSIFRMEATSMMNAENFRANSELKLQGKLEPSALLMITGALRIGFPALESGIKVRAKIRTSVALEALFHVRGNEQLHIEFGFPQTQVELLHYSSDLLVKQGSDYKVIGEIPTSGRNPACSSGLASFLVGIKMCTSSYFSLSPGSDTDDSLSPYFPLNGPSEFKITLDKANPQLVKSRFVYQWNKNETQNNLKLSYETMTIKSGRNETTEIAGLNFDVNRQARDFRLALVTPSYALDGSGRMDEDKSKGSVDFHLMKKQGGSTIIKATGSYVQAISRNKKLLQPKAELVYYGETIAFESDLNVAETVQETRFDGAGSLQWKNEKHDLTIEGNLNASGYAIIVDSEYNRNRNRFLSSGTLLSNDPEHRLFNARLKLDFSANPDSSVDASIFYESDEEGWKSSSELKLADGPSRSSQKGLQLRYDLLFERGHDSSKSRFGLLFVQPKNKIDWNIDLRHNTLGKSMNSALALRYAPGKNFQTSLSLKRATGVLTFLQIGWNITLPDDYPLVMAFHLEEKRYRLYEVNANVDWFNRNSITVAGHYYDKNKRTSIYQSAKLAIKTSSTEQLVFYGLLQHHDEKDSKVEIGMDYGTRKNSIELGHNNKGIVGQTLYLTVRNGQDEYLITGTLERQNGLALVIKTDFGSKFADIYLSANATNHNGMQLYSINYKWDANSERMKQYLAECTMDITRPDIKRFDVILTYDAHQWILKGESSLAQDSAKRALSAKFHFDEDNYIHLLLDLTPTSVKERRLLDGVDAKLSLTSTIDPVPSGILKIKMEKEGEEERKINVDGTWGSEGWLAGSIVTSLKALEDSEDGKENEDGSEEDGGGGAAEGDEQDLDDGESRVLTSGGSRSFEWSLQGRLNSSIQDWETVGIKMHHTHHLLTHFMTDIDIQLAGKNDVSYRGYVRVPRTSSEIWSTRTELSLKTPFVGYQTLDLALVLGQQETSDVLATARVYTENMQYAITVKATLPLELQDGSLGFDITSSHPDFDKIFATLSYTVADTYALNYQCGWPDTVLLLDSNVDWKNSHEFDITFNLTSPWQIAQSLQVVAKMEESQTEWRLYYNDDGFHGECSWSIDSWMMADINLAGGSSYDPLKDFGLVVKSNFDLGEDISVTAHVSGWANDDKLGFKLDVESSEQEIEEEDIIAKISTGTLDVDVALYPTVKTIFKLDQRDEKFNLQLSFLLPDGPINVVADLNLLDVYRFNERIVITTPYSSLMELEIDLTPAIDPQGLYNLGIATRWRSGSHWHQGGLVIRYGDQKILQDILKAEQNDLDGGEEDDDNEGSDGEDPPKLKPQVSVPHSQILHFYSPISWAKEIRVEVEPMPQPTENDDVEEESDDEMEESGDKFPYRTLAVQYVLESGEISTSIKNEDLIKEGKILVKLPFRDSELHLEVGADLNLEDSEKTATVYAKYLSEELQTIKVKTVWEYRSDYFKAKTDLETPWEALEQGSASVMYAKNEFEKLQTFSLELENPNDENIDITIGWESNGLTFDFKSPFQVIRQVWVNATMVDDKTAGSGPKKLAKVEITGTSHDQDIEANFKIKLQDKWPKEIEGTLSSTSGGENSTSTITFNADTSRATSNFNGKVNWSSGGGTADASINIKHPKKRFQELEVKVVIPYRDNQVWHLNVAVPDYATEDEDIERYTVRIKGVSPLQHFATFQSNSSMEIGSSYLDIRKLELSGKTPTGSVSSTTFWNVEQWNNFEIESNSSFYFLPQENSEPIENFLELGLRNKIPSFQPLSSLDSLFNIAASGYRLSGKALLELDSDMLLEFGLGAETPTRSHSGEFKGSCDEELKNLEAHLVASLGREADKFKSRFHLTRDDGSLDGEANIEWENDSSSSIRSTFNYSATHPERQLHLHIFNPAKAVAAESYEDLTTDTVSFKFDGQFNNETGIGSATLLTACCDGTETRTNIHASVRQLSDFETTLNYTATKPLFFSNTTTAGLRLSTKFQSREFAGNYGGHWNDQEASVAYKAVYYRRKNKFIIGLTLDSQIPLQDYNSSVIDLYYKMEPTITESKLGLEWNNVKLIRSNLTHTVAKVSAGGSESSSFAIDLDNYLWPIGVISDYSRNVTEGALQSVVQMHGLEIYDLLQPDTRRMRGEIKTDTKPTGVTYIVAAVHPTRRVEVTTQYELLESQVKHFSKLAWGTDSYIGYFLNGHNLSSPEKREYKGELRIVYPEREMLVSSHLEKRGRVTLINTDWKPDARRKTHAIVALLKLEDQGSLDKEFTTKATLTIKHPTLKKEIKTDGEFRVDRDTMDVKVKLDYGGKPEQTPTFMWRVKVHHLNPRQRRWNISSETRLQHRPTNLDIRTFSTSLRSAEYLSMTSTMDYKSSQGADPDTSKFAFEIFKPSRKLVLSLNAFNLTYNATGQLNSLSNGQSATLEAYEDDSPICKAEATMDFIKPYYNFYWVHGTDLSNGIFSQGGMVDTRNVRFEVAEIYDSYRFSDIDFYLRINNSRLATSKLHWRPDLIEDTVENYRGRFRGARESWNQQSTKLFQSASTEACAVADKVWQDAKPSLGAFVAEMSSQLDFSKDSAALADFINSTYTNDHFYSQELVRIYNLTAQEASIRFSDVFVHLRDYRTRLIGEPSYVFDKTVLWVLEKLREIHEQVSSLWNRYQTYSIADSVSVVPIKEAMSSFIHHLLTATATGFGHIFDSLATLGSQIVSGLQTVVEKYKPDILTVGHEVEKYLYELTKQISDYLYKTKNEVMSSDYYQNLADDIDQLYLDLTEQDAPANIRKYYGILRNYTFEALNKGQELDIFGETLSDLWTEITQFQVIQQLSDSWTQLGDKLTWLAEYLNLEETFQDVLVAVYMKGGDLVHQTALEATSRHQQAKTKFIFDPNKGIMEWEQKLPMPWKAFNETPAFQELPEYRMVNKLKNALRPAEPNVWQTLPHQNWNQVWQKLTPPFKGHATIVGSSYLLTFDGLVYNFSSNSCGLLLAGDLVDGNFSIVLKTLDEKKKAPSYSILVSVMRNTLAIDFSDNSLKSVKKNESSKLPLPVQYPYVEGYQMGNKIIVESSKGVAISCDMHYKICDVEISGWYSRKIGGLLGTMDHEYTTDMIIANRSNPDAFSTHKMIKSWEISEDTSPTCSIDPGSAFNLAKVSTGPSSPSIPCNKLFASYLSSLQPCFGTVNVDPFMGMCANDNLESSVCTAAEAYVKTCARYDIQVKMPSTCIKCELNGEQMIDRDVRFVNASTSTTSSDVVFIVEAKDCNKNLLAQKKLDLLKEKLQAELSQANIGPNRYALVVFGGNGVFDKPRPLTHNNQAFTQPSITFASAFGTSITPGNGSRDIFEAIALALQMDFRPGVSKTFILIPCSTCQPQQMTMDFSAIHHAMLEQDVTLHILMNDDFSFETKNSGKKFFGMDSNFGFTKADSIQPALRGETKMRQLVKPPKKVLGHCLPLALETGGSVFTAKRLQNKKSEMTQHFTKVFSRRVVQTAKVAPCQQCYCTANPEGIGKIKCYPCQYPRYQFELDESSEESDDQLATTTASVSSTDSAVSEEEEEPEDLEEDDE